MKTINLELHYMKMIDGDIYADSKYNKPTAQQVYNEC